MGGAKLRRRRGLGCLGGLAALLLLGVLATVAIDAAFAPWIYVVGGKHRLLPVWAGSGDAMGPGGRYRVWVWFSPTPKGTHTMPGVAVQGSGWVCSPRGQLIKLKVFGGANDRVWNDMDGHSFHLEAYHRPVFLQVSGSDTWRPRLRFSGAWVGPDLAMTDNASLAHAFRLDGSLDPTARTGWRPTTGAVPITLKEGTWQVFPPTCGAAAG